MRDCCLSILKRFCRFRSHISRESSMRSDQLIPLIGAIFTLSACCSSIRPIDLSAISAVQDDINRQVGVYISSEKYPVQVSVLQPDQKTSVLYPVGQAPLPPNVDESERFLCGSSGDIRFDVFQIKADLTTTLNTSIGATLSASPPVGVLTVGPSLGGSSSTTNSQDLVYQVWPIPYGSHRNAPLANAPVSNEDLDRAPIAKVLFALRQALVLQSLAWDFSKNPAVRKPKLKPCYTDYDPLKPETNTANIFTLSLSVVNDINAALAIKAPVVSLGITADRKSTTGHTLTVSFDQPGLEDVQAAQDAVEEECKYPHEKTPKCVAAQIYRSQFYEDDAFGPVATSDAPLPVTVGRGHLQVRSELKALMNRLAANPEALSRGRARAITPPIDLNKLLPP